MSKLCAGQIVLLSSPTPLLQPQGQRKNVCDKKGLGTRKKGEISDYIGRSKEKNKVRREPGQPKKSDVQGMPGGDGGRTI